MVVGTHNYYAFVIGAFNLFYPIYSSSTVYLYPILEDMKKALLIFFIIVILFSVFVYYNNSNLKTIISALRNKGDIQSDNLRYRVYLWGILPLGEAVLSNQGIEEYRDEKIYHLSATAQSLPIFSGIFKGYAKLDSYIDINQLNPILFKQKITVMGREEINREIIYDQTNGIMTIDDTKRQILPDTQDPLSAIFNIRRIDFNKIKDIEMSINTNQKNYLLKSTIGQKDLSINKEIYKLVLARAEIKRRDGNPYHKSDIEMVLLSEKENIPILIKVFASGLSITAKLINTK